MSSIKERVVIAKDLYDLIQTDLAEMQPYSRNNKGYRYVLFVKNVFGTFVWTQPVKRKTSKDVANVMKKFLLEMDNIPKKCKQRSEKNFTTKNLKNLCNLLTLNIIELFLILKPV